jgi:hypothetical protein
LNDFEFSDTVDILKGDPQPILTELMDTLPADPSYSYVFEGSSITSWSASTCCERRRTTPCT